MREASASKNICWQKFPSLQLCSYDTAYPQSTSPDILVILRPEVANLLFGQPLLFGDIDPLFQIFLCGIRNSQESDGWQNPIKNTGEKNSFVWERNTNLYERASPDRRCLLPCKSFCFQLLLSKTWPKLSGGRWHLNCFVFITNLSVKWDGGQAPLQRVQVKTEELLIQWHNLN